MFPTPLKTVLNSFVCDSFILPAHWCYVTLDIEEKLVPAGYFGEKLLAPGLLNEYHKPKTAGDQTHYGDQMFWLLEHLAEGQLLDGWSKKWLQKITDKSYIGYKDHASKDTIENWEKGICTGKIDTDDLAGVSRFAPLLALFKGSNESDFIQLVQHQTAITHANPILKDISSMIGSWAFKVHEKPNEKPSHLLKTISIPESLHGTLEKALRLDPGKNDFENVDSLGEIKEYGGKKIGTARSCAWKGAFPATIYLICKYEEIGLYEALKANALIGGDSAARGIIITTILSPYSEQNGKVLPAGWYQGLKLEGSIETLLEKINNSY